MTRASAFNVRSSVRSCISNIIWRGERIPALIRVLLLLPPAARRTPLSYYTRSTDTLLFSRTTAPCVPCRPRVLSLDLFFSLFLYLPLAFSFVVRNSGAATFRRRHRAVIADSSAKEKEKKAGRGRNAESVCPRSSRRNFRPSATHPAFYLSVHHQHCWPVAPKFRV